MATETETERFGHQGRWWRTDGERPRHPPKKCANCGADKRSPTDLLCPSCWSYVPAAIRVSYYEAIEHDFTSDDTRQVLHQIFQCAPDVGER